MKQIVKFNLGFICCFTFLGCTSSPVKSTSASNKYTRSVKTQTVEQLSAEIICPKKLDFSQAQDWKDLVKVANACVKNKRWSEVEALGNHLSQKEYLSPWGVYFLSLVSLERDEHRRALWMIENALTKSPSLGLFHYQKGRIFWQMNEFDSALASFEESLRLDSTNLEVHLLLGQIYLRDLDYAKAAEHLAIVQQQKKKDIVVLDQLSYCYFKLNRAKESLDLLDVAISQAPKRLELRLRQGLILQEQIKDEEGALAVFRRTKYLLNKGQLIGKPSFNIDEKIKNLEVAVHKKKESSQKKISLNASKAPSGEVAK